MRVRLKGIHRITKHLANESTAVYHYTRRGGPRLPGDLEFAAAFNGAVAKTVQEATDTLQTVLHAYQSSPKCLDLASRTRKDYIRQIESEFGELPIEALLDRRTRS